MRGEKEFFAHTIKNADKKIDTGGEKEEREKKSELLDRLRVIIQTISGRKNLKIVTEVDPQIAIEIARQGKDAEREWYTLWEIDPETKEKIELVHIPKEIIDNEIVAKGKASHEAGHVAITRLGEIIPDEVMQKLGFHSMIDAIEERPTDQVVKKHYPGAGKWLSEARKDSVKKNAMSIITQGGKNKNYTPKFLQLCDLIVYEPYLGEIPDYYDKDVVGLYEEVKKDIEKIEKTLPEEKAPEPEVIKKAEDRYKVAYSKVWPKVKKLIKNDLDEEQLRQMIKESEELKGKKEKDGEAPINKLPKGLKNKLKNLINQAQNAKNKNERGTGKEGEKKDVESGETIPLNSIDNKLKKALMKIFNSLPESEQRRLKETAIESLEKMEDDFVGELESKLIENPKNHKEYKLEKKKEERRKRVIHQKKKIEEKLRNIEKQQVAIQESSSIYDKTYEEIRELDEKLYRELEEIFLPNIKSKIRLKSTGLKLNLPAVFKWEAGKGGGAKELDNQLFESKHLPDKKDYVFTILVDLSGSMKGKKINETFKGVVLLAELLNRLGVRNEILGFQDEIIDFKDFNQNLTNIIREKISGMIAEVSGINPGGHNMPPYNDDGPCLLEASNDLKKQPGREKFLIVLSDGLPEGSRSDKSDLSEAVEKIIRTTNQKLIGLGLGPETKFVKDFYPISLPNINVKKLSEVLGGLLKDMIVNPEKYQLKE